MRMSMAGVRDGACRLPDHQCGLDDTRWACVHRARCLRPIAIDDGDVPPIPYPWTNGSGGVRAFRHRDCAMDIAGKLASLPIASLLGGAPRELTAYASLLRYAEPELVASAVERALSQGF